jgi:EF hand domain-containing protein
MVGAATCRVRLTSHALTSKEIAMTLKTLIAAAVAAAFAWPLAAGADDKASTGASAGSDKSAAQPSSSDKASAGATKDDGGAEAMFKALDKNNDGYISKEEAKGTPHDKDFAKLDKNGDGKLSREEHAAAPEHAGKAKSGSAAGASSSTDATTSGGMSSGSKSKY